MSDIIENMSPETQKMFDVCDQYCDGEINLEEALKKYREFIPSASDEELRTLLNGFKRNNVINLFEK